MCTLTIKVDDKLRDDFLQTLGKHEPMEQVIQRQVISYMTDCVKHARRSRRYSKDEVLRKLRSISPDEGAMGFLRLKGILPPDNRTDREIIDEYLEEKYGV